jgi:hypothetical protein
MLIESNKTEPIMANEKVHELSKHIIPKLSGFNINEITKLCDILIRYAVVDIKAP